MSNKLASKTEKGGASERGEHGAERADGRAAAGERSSSGKGFRSTNGGQSEGETRRLGGSPPARGAGQGGVEAWKEARLPRSFCSLPFRAVLGHKAQRNSPTVSTANGGTVSMLGWIRRRCPRIDGGGGISLACQRLEKDSHSLESPCDLQSSAPAFAPVRRGRRRIEMACDGINAAAANVPTLALRVDEWRSTELSALKSRFKSEKRFHFRLSFPRFAGAFTIAPPTTTRTPLPVSRT